MYELREYQKEPVRRGIDFFKQTSPYPSIMVLPTAAGKSIIIAKILKEVNEKTIVLQPSKELLEQNYEKFISLEGEASIFSASMNTKEYGNITYATIGSIKSLGKEFCNYGYKNLIIDEAHMFSRSDQGMLQTFLKDANIKKVLGLTATAFKLQTNSYGFGQKYSMLKMLTSKSKHGNFFKDIIHVTQVQELTKQGYWSKLLYELYDSDTGSLIFNSTGAEYTDSSIDIFYKSQKIETKIINKLNEIDRKSILVFVPRVDDAISLSEKVKDSAAVWGNMDKKERVDIIRRFRAGEIRTIFNVNVLSVGFDYPEIDGIIIGRPTASLTWMYQALGRGTRIHPNKENCLVVDFTNNVRTFGKIEDIYYKKGKIIWDLYGSGNRLLSNIDISQIKPMIGENDIIFPFGKYYGKRVTDAPNSYLQWLMKEFKFNANQEYLKQEVIRVQNARIKTLELTN